MTGRPWLAAIALGLVASAPTRAGELGQAVVSRQALCDAAQRSPTDAAQALQAFGDDGRGRLLQLAAADQVADAACGIAGLAALRDRRLVPLVQSALTRVALQSETYRLLRWAAYVAGGPESDLGPAFLPIVDTLTTTVWANAGDDAIRLLGEVDDPAARDRLVREFDRPQSDSTVDALIHALARQGEPRVREHVTALGREAVGARSGNATYEQARRIGAVAFYQLALATDAMTDGLRMLGQLAPRDQEDAAAWAVQTWCERSVRRPTAREAATRARLALVAEFDRLNVRWSHLDRGSFSCLTTP